MNKDKNTKVKELQMKYEAEDFEVLKSTVKHFMKNNPNSDMSVVMEYRTYPYNQTDDAYASLNATS